MDSSRRKFSRTLLSALSLSSAGLLSACMGMRPMRAPILPHQRVLALGDSLTYGIGATPEHSYPAILSEMAQWDIINAGVPGSYSSEALKRLPQLLHNHRPSLVLTCIGINDYANPTEGMPKENTYANLKQICELVAASSAQHVLIATPYITRPALAKAAAFYDAPVYKRVADEMNVPLLENAFTQVLANPALRADDIHANDKGYAQLSKALALFLYQENFLLYNDRWAYYTL